MRYLICLTLVSVFLTCTSCNELKSPNVEERYIHDFLRKITLPSGTEWVIILPGLGCHGCIQEGEAFMKDNINKKGVFFVLTSVESLKMLQRKINIDIKKQKNVYVDIDNMFQMPSNNRIYPCIVRLDGGEVQECQFQSPKNSQAFHSLESRLKAQEE